ncbi:MAG: Fe-S cluster domain protein [Methanolobus sp. T82-4]|nr:MAG: Fe-S cluster domain protein [Methanolobus sp. T82-4]
MRVISIEQVLPCIADPWKLRLIAQLDERPDLHLLAKHLPGRYSENLGIVIAKSGYREITFYSNGKVTVRMVDSPGEGQKFINGMLAMVYNKALIEEL